MGKIKNHGIPESAKDMMKHFGKDAFRLNAHEKKFIREQGFDTEYLFIETKEQRAAQKGWCSHCREWLTLPVYTPERLAHKEEVKCPKCGCELIVQHAWRMRKNLYDEALVYLYRPSVINPEVVTARAVVVQRWWGVYCANGSPLDMEPDVDVDSFYVFEPGVGGSMLKPINNGRIYCVKKFRSINQVLYEKATVPSSRDVRYLQATVPSSRDVRYLQKWYSWGCRNWVTVTTDTEEAFRAAEGSPLRYGMSEYEPHGVDHFLRYWHWAARHPSVEKLVKIGLGEAVAKKITYGGGGDCINWRGKDLAEILKGRLTKEDKAFLLTNGDDVDPHMLKIWQFLGGKLSVAEVAQRFKCSDWQYVIRRLELIKQRAGDMEKVLRYLAKNTDRTLDLYDDYLSECEHLGYDMTDKAVLFPRNLRTAHDRTMAQIKYKQNQSLETEYEKKRRPVMKRKYEWAAMGMVVIVPEHVSDLIAEGEKQHNCVGGYMERVAKGQTDVVFIRKDKAPEKSYITMEIHNGRIIQARTKNNGPLDKLGRKFVEAFRAEKLEKKRKARKSA